jgi:hypothetical protein
VHPEKQSSPKLLMFRGMLIYLSLEQEEKQLFGSTDIFVGMVTDRKLEQPEKQKLPNDVMF